MVGFSLPSLSEVNSFMQCQQQWYWRYIRRIQRPMRPEPMERGSLIHLGLAIYYGMEPHDSITAAQAMYTAGNRDWERYATLAEPDEDEAKKFQAMLTLCERVLKLYDAYYVGERAELNSVLAHIVAVEREFTSPLHRIVDMVTQDDYGLVWAWEHKTSSRMPDLSSLTATMEPALTCLAANADGFIYNIITTDPIKFVRQDFTISQEQKDYAHSWYSNVVREITGISCKLSWEKNDMGVMGLWISPVIPAHNRTCAWCEYLKLCQLMSSGRDTEDVIDRLYVPKTERGATEDV